MLAWKYYLRNCRNKTLYTIPKLANESHIPADYIYDMELGNKRAPPVGQLCTLIRLLGMDKEEAFTVAAMDRGYIDVIGENERVVRLGIRMMINNEKIDVDKLEKIIEEMIK